MKRIQLFSDSCVGQNKNFCVVTILSMFAARHNVHIEYIFPVRNHSYMLADCAFGRVEQILKKQQEMLLPSEYYDSYKEVGSVYVFREDWDAYNYKTASDSLLKKPLPFKISQRVKLSVSVLVAK